MSQSENNIQKNVEVDQQQTGNDQSGEEYDEDVVVERQYDSNTLEDSKEPLHTSIPAIEGVEDRPSQNKRPKSKGDEKNRKSSPSRRRSPSRSPTRSPSRSARKEEETKQKATTSFHRRHGKSSKPEDITVKRSGFIERKIHKRVKQLKIIDLSNEGLSAIPATHLQGLLVHVDKYVGELYLNGNNMRNLSSGIARLKYLVKLDLSKNPIRVGTEKDEKGLPLEIAQLTHLETLVLTECGMPVIPSALWKLRKLKHLELARNRIQMLPPNIGDLEGLEVLNLTSCGLSSLPLELAFCQQLRVLILHGNPVDNLPESFKELLKLEELEMNYRAFAALVPAYKEELIKSGQIQSDHMPTVITEMIELTSLDLSNNYLEEITAEIGNLRKLNKLSIKHNKLRAIPDELGQITELQELELDDNRLKRMFSSIHKLQNLTRLTVSKNKLRDVSLGICELTNIETLDLSNNQIRQLPVEFTKLKLLEAHCHRGLKRYGLWVIENPINLPPPQVYKSMNPEKIFTFLKKYAVSQTKNLHRQKIAFIGDAGIGKTTLCNALRLGKSISSKTDSQNNRLNYEPTALIKTHKWTTENKVPFIIFDLSGEEFYRSLLHFFIDNNTLFVIVYRTTMTLDESITYTKKWIDFLKTRVKGCILVMLVAVSIELPDEAAEGKSDILVQKLIEDDPEDFSLVSSDFTCDSSESETTDWCRVRFLDSKTIPRLNCGDPLKGIQELRDTLELVAINKHLMPAGQRIENTSEWNEIIKKIKTTSKLSITVEEIRKMANIEKAEADRLLFHLTATGEVIRFKNSFQFFDRQFETDLILPRISQFATTVVDIFNKIQRIDLSEKLNSASNQPWYESETTWEHMKLLDYAKNPLYRINPVKFDENSFEKAVKKYKEFGKISRPLADCLWFTVERNGNLTNENIDTLEKLGILYQNRNDESNGDYIDKTWITIPAMNSAPRPTTIELGLTGWSASMGELCECIVNNKSNMSIPKESYYRLVCRLNSIVERLMAWENVLVAQYDSIHTVYIEYDSEEIRIKTRTTEGKNEEIVRAFERLVKSTLENQDDSQRR